MTTFPDIPLRRFARFAWLLVRFPLLAVLVGGFGPYWCGLLSEHVFEDKLPHSRPYIWIDGLFSAMVVAFATAVLLCLLFACAFGCVKLWDKIEDLWYQSQSS